MKIELPVHLCIIQPGEYVHALGFLDQARYFRHHLRRLGVEVSIGKNRLRHDAVNLVFGAHLGFDPAWRQRHACVFVNLEQLGEGGAQVPPAYLALLRSSGVIDYDVANVSAYADEPADVPIVPMLFAPFLREPAAPPLQDRPIDLLFFGSMNERRRTWIEAIEALGVNVSVFDTPLYGAERDAYIRQSKAVFNAHFYESARFEQVRVSHCLSLGTPVISERRPGAHIPAAFEDSVTWVTPETLAQTFGHEFGRAAFFERAQAQLANFAQADPIEAFADLMAFCLGFAQESHRRRDVAPWLPGCIKLGATYRPGVLNIDREAGAQPDLQLDLSTPLALPWRGRSELAGPVHLHAGSVSMIAADETMATVSSWPVFMDNALCLLQLGGELLMELPAHTVVQGRLASRPEGWAPFTDAFWRSGWFEHHFELRELAHLDAQRQATDVQQCDRVRVRLIKVDSSAMERTRARVMRADFGLGHDDADDLAEGPGLSLVAAAA